MILSHEHLRKLKDSAPEVVERLINLHGSAGFSEYVDGLLKRGQSGSADSAAVRMTSTLSALRAEHDRFFPKLALKSEVFSEKNAACKEKIQMIASRFPHIGKNLVEMWGKRDFCEYIGDLFIDKRGGRQGFPSDILFALCDLREEHDKEYPEFVREVTNVWVRVN